MKKTIRPENKTIVAYTIDEPTERAEEIRQQMQSKKHWKEPTDIFYTNDADLAQEVQWALTYSYGGADSDHKPGRVVNGMAADFAVFSAGYFHYIGS